MTKKNARSPKSKSSPQRAFSYEAVYAIVRRIPKGRVATYGQIAAIAGIPRHARRVGYALAALRDDIVPWQRVVNAKGEVSPRADAAYDEFQRRMLESEGVVFDRRGRIDLQRYQWRPRVPREPPAAAGVRAASWSSPLLVPGDRALHADVHDPGDASRRSRRE